MKNKKIETNCRSCGKPVTVTDTIEVVLGRVAQCEHCGLLAWTDVKDDIIVVFFTTGDGQKQATVYPSF